jgi:hypothetical protein
MNPAAIILPLFLLAIVMVLMIGSTIWPHLQAETPEGLAAIDKHAQDERVQLIVKFFSDRLSFAFPNKDSNLDNYKAAFGRALAVNLGRYIFLHGDLPGRISSSGWRSGLVTRSLGFGSEPTAIEANIDVQIGTETIWGNGNGYRLLLWALPKPPLKVATPPNNVA